jgi:hypothetical protein
MNNKKLHKWLMEEFRACVDMDVDLRKRQLEERRFAALDQWPQDIRRARENDINGARPCLTIDKTSQYRQQIVNEIRKNRPAVKVRPVDSDSDPETAKIFQAKIRHIEDRSLAHIAYQCASEWAIDVGEGYFRFVTEYGEDGKQEICIKSIPNRFCVYMGQHLMPDGSDAELCFITEDMPVKSFRKQYPKARYKSADLEIDGANAMYWNADEKIRVAECFYLDMDAEEEDPPSDDNAKDTGDESVVDSEEKDEPAEKLVQWVKFTAAGILEEREFPCRFVPVVKVVGHERFIDGKIDRWGLIRPVIDPQRQYNYWASVLVENLGLTARSKWLMAEGQDAGHELMWASSNKSTDPRLIYKPTDISGQQVPPPTRIPSGSPDVAVLQQLPLLEHDIQTAIGMFKASVGDASSDQSGRAIRSLQSQSDTATFNFPDNVADSIAYGGRIMLDMIPRTYDVKQILRLIGEDGKPQSVTIDPQQKQARREIQTRQGVKNIYNLGVGIYDVTAKVGPSYATRRMEASEFGMELIKTQPELLKLIGHIVFRELDIDGADEIAEIFEKMLPPELQKPKEGQPQLPPQVIQQIMQMKQQMQMMGEELQKEKAGTQEAMAKIQVSAQAENQRIQLSAQTAQQQLAIQKETQDRQAQLAREKAEAEFSLKKWAAEQELELDRMKAQAANEQTVQKADFDQQITAHKIRTEAAHAAAHPSTANPADERVATVLQEVLQRLTAKKSIKLVQKDGRIVGGEITTEKLT